MSCVLKTPRKVNRDTTGWPHRDARGTGCWLAGEASPAYRSFDEHDESRTFLGACGGILTSARQAVAPRTLLRHNLSMAGSNSARVVISWSAKANAYVARDPARPGGLARGATVA